MLKLFNVSGSSVEGVGKLRRRNDFFLAACEEGFYTWNILFSKADEAEAIGHPQRCESEEEGFSGMEALFIWRVHGMCLLALCGPWSRVQIANYIHPV